MKYLCIFLIAFLMTTRALSADLKLVTGATEPMVSENGDAYLNVLFGEVFRRISTRIQINSLPPLRALNEANLGVYDGDLQRIAGLDQEFENLVRVPEKINEYDFVAFSKTQLKKNYSFSSLNRIRVGYLRGWKFYELNVPKKVEVQVVDKPEQLMQLLKKGRIDVALYSKWEGYYWASKLDLSVYVSDPPFKSMDMFLYLNKRHLDLVMSISQILKGMKKDGTYEQIRKEKLYVFSPQAVSQN